MSHQEKHPLDERFRQVLHQAEVAPPPALWEAVKQARDGGRRKAGWWRWSFPALALLLLVGATATYYALRSPNTDRERAGSMPVTRTGAHGHQPLAGTGMKDGADTADLPIVEAYTSTTSGRVTAEVGSDRTTDAGPAVATITPKSLGNDSGQAPGMGPSRTMDQVRSSEADDPSGVAFKAPATPMDVQPTTATSTEHSHAENPSETLASTEFSGLANDLVAERLALRPSLSPITDARSLPVPAPKPPSYLLPHGEWWVAPVVGAYTFRDRWRGEDGGLVNALGNASGTSSTFAFGIAAGRQWRSGFGLSSGLLAERTESRLYHHDRRVHVEQEIITYLVTLNTQVFVSDVDTITTVTTDDRSSSGSLRRTAWRVPLDLHWRCAAGRWQFGLHGGFALELTSAQGASLVMADGEGRLVAADPGAAELRARHPAALLGSVGAEVGWMLNERWTLWVDPVYMTGVSALAPTSAAYTLPQRFGVQFGLAHHFIPSRSK